MSAQPEAMRLAEAVEKLTPFIDEDSVVLNSAAAELRRLQEEVGILRSDWSMHIKDIADQRDEISRLHALNAQMLEALGALLEGCEYKSFDGEEPKWHRKSMARDSALELARIAIAAAKEQA